MTQAGNTILQRVQTGGPASLNIPSTQMFELGDWNTIGYVYDIPDMSWQCDTVDVSCDFEAKLTNTGAHAIYTEGTGTPSASSTVGAGVEVYDFNKSIPLDVISPFKSLRGAYDITAGAIVPYLALDTVSYKFGVRQNSTASFTMKGDSVFYTQGVPFYEEIVLTAAANHTYSFGYPAPPGGSIVGSSGWTNNVFHDSGNSIYAYSVCVVHHTTGAYKRLFFGTDYTNTASGFTLIADWTASNPAYDTVRVTYAATSSNTVLYPQSVSKLVGIASGQIPAAVRGLDVSVSIGGTGQGATPVMTKFSGVQTAQIDRKVNLVNDEELGNHQYVDISYDVATVTGSLEVKPFDVLTFINQIKAITGVTDNTVGPIVNVPVPLEIAIKDHNTGVVLKSFEVPQCQFEVPGLQGRANTQLTTKFDFKALDGRIFVYNGAIGGANTGSAFTV